MYKEVSLYLVHSEWIVPMTHRTTLKRPKRNLRLSETWDLSQDVVHQSSSFGKDESDP